MYAPADFFASDLHLGHYNIIRYCQRPYGPPKSDDPRDQASVMWQMNHDIIARWNSVVGDEHHVWVLGDVLMGNLGKMLPTIRMLNGIKHLLVGNHDQPFRKDPQAEPTARSRRGEQQYLEAGFVEIVHGTLHVTGTQAGLGTDTGDVTVSHFPYRGDSGNHDDRYRDHRPPDNGGWLIHGHVHDQWLQRGRMINVGLDAWGGYPVPAADIAAIIDAGERDRDPIRWEATHD